MTRLVRLVLAAWMGAAVLVVTGQVSAAADDATPVIAGTFAGQLRLSDSWVPGGWGFKPGARSYAFGKGCPVGSTCEIDRLADGTRQALTPAGGGFGWSGSDPIGCVDNVSGVMKTDHGFDYTYTVRLTPAGSTTRDGVTYVTALRGTIEGKLTVNATGRRFDCLVNPRRVPSETEHGVYDLKLVPLAAVKPVTSTPPLAVTPPSSAGTASLPAFHLPQTTRQQASATAVADGRRSSFPGSLTTPSEAVSNLGDRLPQDLLLVALLGLLMIFPAQIFNSTYEDNHERIDRQLVRLRLRRRKPVVAPQQPRPDAAAISGAEGPVPPRGRRLAVFVACALVGSLLGGFLDPGFGADTASYALVVGLFAALVVAVLVSAFAARLFRTVTHHGRDWYLRAIPSALLIGVLCVVVSRVTHFEPGYLYGVLGGAVFAMSLERRSEGRAEVAVSVTALVVALAAWVVFDPVARAADGTDPSFLLLSADSFLAALFIGGIEGLLFGLIPLRFLPGYRVRSWSWAAWGVLTAVVLFTFVHVLLMPESGYLGRSTAASVRLSVALFIAFGIASGLFWLWFRLRPSTDADPDASADETASTARPRRRIRVAAGAPDGEQPLGQQGQSEVQS